MRTNMKANSSILVEKSFNCDVDGCLMKFANEDQLTVHKKRHGMVLNIGAGSKGNTVADQTPTPTTFIRNCEEVGLFQDLQNVNPFEEPFRRAVEAVKTGQNPILDKSFQTNPSDDTLHTPKVFPHIPGLPCINQNENINRVIDCQEDLSKKDNDNTEEKVLSLKSDIEPEKLILGNKSHKKRMKENFIRNEVIQEQCIINEKNSSLPDQNNSYLNPVQATLNRKIKSNIQAKNSPVILQLKVPIPKSTTVYHYQKTPKNVFSTFTKNSLKYGTELLQKQQTVTVEVPKKQRGQRIYSELPKDRIELLERNRAAATRWRQKKKMYVSYLEKCNKQLTEENKRLQTVNVSLKRQLAIAQAELLKHKNCILNSSKEEAVMASFEGMKSLQIGSNVCHKISQDSNNELLDSGISQNTIEPNNVDSNFVNKLETTMFETVEVCMADDSDNKYIQDTTTSNNDTVNTTVLEGDKIYKVYTDHSYFNFSNVADARKRSRLNKKKPKLKLTLSTNGNQNCNVNNFCDTSQQSHNLEV